MTAQISDAFIYQGQQYALAGYSGGPLFDPGEYNLHPFPRITSCWRGYVCTYALHADRLVLDQLEVSLGGPGMPGPAAGRGPLINGVAPTDPGQAALFDNLYQGLGLAIPFTGNLQIAQGFIRDLYVHMGFQPAWKYETVLELTFTTGQFVSVEDISAMMSRLRAEQAKRGNPY